MYATSSFCALWCHALSISSFWASGNSLGTDMLTEHPLLSEPSSVSFYNWMSNAVGNRTGAVAQDSPVNRSQHNSLQTGQRGLSHFGQSRLVLT